MTGEQIRLLVVDDDQLARKMIADLLGRVSGLKVVGVLGSGAQTLELLNAAKPDVILTDISMPVMSGVQLTAQIVKRSPETKVVCLTSLADEDLMRQALDAGASGFVLKTDSPQLIVEAIRTAHHGDALVSPQLVKRLLKGRAHAGQQSPPELTDAEQDLLRAVADGLTNTEIAERLYLSPATVKTYVSRLLARVGARDRVEMVIFAYKWGIAGD